MKRLLLVVTMLLVTVLLHSQTLIRKDGGSIKVGNTYYPIEGLVFQYNGDNVYIRHAGLKINDKIGNYANIITVDSTYFSSSDECVDFCNSLLVDKSFTYSLSFGELTYMSSIYKFGRNTATGTSEEVIWDGGGEYVFLDSAQYLKVVSTDDDDSLNGSGAWSVFVYGLDSAFNEISEIILLSGLDSVTTTHKFLRTYRAFVYKAGTTSSVNGNNQGNINIVSDDSNDSQAQILAGNGQTLMCVYTVPAGYKGYITGYSLGAGQGKQIVFKSKFRNCSTDNCAFTVKDIREIYQNTFIGTLVTPLEVPEKTDMVITGTCASGDVNATASFGIILRKQ